MYDSVDLEGKAGKNFIPDRNIPALLGLVNLLFHRFLYHTVEFRNAGGGDDVNMRGAPVYLYGRLIRHGCGSDAQFGQGYKARTNPFY